MSRYTVRSLASGYKFDLHAANGQRILTSEVYDTAAACRKGIESVRKNAPAAYVEDLTVSTVQTIPNPKFQLYQDKAGEYRFRLKARNGKIIAVSDSYTAKNSALSGIESVKNNAGPATVACE